MDKYVLVSHDRYDDMVKKEKNSVNSTSNGSITSPPPGLPITDNRSKEGTLLTDEEAESFNQAMIDASYASRKSSTSSEASNQEDSDSDWRKLRQAVKQ